MQILFSIFLFSNASCSISFLHATSSEIILSYYLFLLLENFFAQFLVCGFLMKFPYKIFLIDGERKHGLIPYTIIPTSTLPVLNLLFCASFSSEKISSTCSSIKPKKFSRTILINPISKLRWGNIKLHGSIKLQIGSPTTPSFIPHLCQQPIVN
jgi:hypothetical protein